MTTLVPAADRTGDSGVPPGLVIRINRFNGVKHLVFAGIFAVFGLIQVMGVMAGHTSPIRYALIAFNGVAAPLCVALAMLVFLRRTPLLVTDEFGIVTDVPFMGKSKIPWSQIAGCEVVGRGSARMLAITCLHPRSGAIERTRRVAALCEGMNKQNKVEGAAWIPARQLPMSAEAAADRLREVMLEHLGEEAERCST